MASHEQRLAPSASEVNVRSPIQPPNPLPANHLAGLPPPLVCLVDWIATRCGHVAGVCQPCEGAYRHLARVLTQAPYPQHPHHPHSTTLPCCWWPPGSVDAQDFLAWDGELDFGLELESFESDLSAVVPIVEPSDSSCCSGGAMYHAQSDAVPAVGMQVRCRGALS